MNPRSNTYIRLCSALLFSVLVHVLVLWLVPLEIKSPYKPKERVHIIRLVPQIRPIERPPLRRKVVPRRPLVRKNLRKKRQKRRITRKKRRKIKKKRLSKRRRTKKQRLTRRQRVAIAVRKPPPDRRMEPQPPRQRPDAPPPRRDPEIVRKRPSYRHLDLRPQRLPTLARRPAARGGKGTKGTKGTKPGKGKLTPWAGSSQFARNMRAYHNRFVEDLNDRRGLVDTFFGTATVKMDRCMETWFQRNITKHLTTKELIGWFSWRNGAPTRSPQWRGTFTVNITASGKRTIKMNKSRGLRKLDDLVYKTASRCMKRLVLPKRLKGKRIYMKFSTKTLAYYRTEIKNLFGLTETRNAQTGGMEWKFTHFGSVHVSSNTLILRQRVY